MVLEEKNAFSGLLTELDELMLKRNFKNLAAQHPCIKFKQIPFHNFKKLVDLLNIDWERRMVKSRAQVA